jgi:NAD(P)-dependent dehydrogenase (short-subunit alcohol dehydrogenase family)
VALIAGATRGAGRAFAVPLLLRGERSVAAERAGSTVAAVGVTDIDGSRPDCWGLIAAYGWDHGAPADLAGDRS